MSGKELLERLQSLDDAAKRRLLVIGTTFAMLIVIVVWFKYFNSIIQPISGIPEVVPEEHGFSPWESAKNGVALIVQALFGLVRFVSGLILGPKNILIQPNL